MFRYEHVNSTRKFTIVSEIVSLGVANGIRKIQGLGNFCSDLEISEAF